MRIVVWNAYMSFGGRKQTALAELGPDIAVIPECGSLVDVPAGCSAWVGSNRHKGLAVLSYGDYRVSLDSKHDASIQWAAPITVTGPHSFFLLAIWEQRPYGEGVQSALELYRDRLTSGAAVVAGDFNQSSIWDRPNRPRNHTRTVGLLEELGLASAYHHHFEVDQGKELHPTHYWHYNPATTFHIDYCFMPEQWCERITAVAVGSASDWIHTVPRLSDHVPLIVDVELTPTS